MTRTIGFLTVDQKGRTTLPRELREELGITDQMQIRVDRTDDGVYELVPAVMIPQDQLWYHSPEGRERLRAAEESFREGRSTRTNGEAETQRFLDSLKKSTTRRSRKR
jgi:bifunctional DNA-binding transcriptional regulator/antitoxin component of YhaV-PrlF toxin-antitoxin module